MEVSGYLGFLHRGRFTPKQTFHQQTFQGTQVETARPRMSLSLHSVSQAEIQGKSNRLPLLLGYDM